MVELADSIPESADSTTDFTIVGRLSISNMFNISTPTQLADSSRSTIAVGRLQIVLVGMGLSAAFGTGRGGRGFRGRGELRFDWFVL